jgi:hypothetical protein
MTPKLMVTSIQAQVCVVTVFAKAFFGKGVADIGLANAGQYISDKYGHAMVSSKAAPALSRMRTCMCSCNHMVAGALHSMSQGLLLHAWGVLMSSNL